MLTNSCAGYFLSLGGEALGMWILALAAKYLAIRWLLGALRTNGGVQ